MWTAQEPPTAANVATAAKVSVIPASRGSPLFKNGCSARANTNGSTGRMHGLRIVSMPPRKTRTISVIYAFRLSQYLTRPVAQGFDCNEACLDGPAFAIARAA